MVLDQLLERVLVVQPHWAQKIPSKFFNCFLDHTIISGNDPIHNNSFNPWGWPHFRSHRVTINKDPQLSFNTFNLLECCRNHSRDNSSPPWLPFLWTLSIKGGLVQQTLFKGRVWPLDSRFPKNVRISKGSYKRVDLPFFFLTLDFIRWLPNLKPLIF